MFSGKRLDKDAFVLKELSCISIGVVILCVYGQNSSNKNMCILLYVNCTSIKLIFKKHEDNTGGLLSDNVHFLGESEGTQLTEPL